MKCKIQKLHVLAFAGTFTFFYYEAMNGSVTQEGYFNSVWQRMKPGDIILVTETDVFMNGEQFKNNAFFTVQKSNRDGVTIARQDFSMGIPLPPPQIAMPETPSTASPNSACFIKHRGFGRFDVLDGFNNRLNEGPMTKEEATLFASKYNEEHNAA